MNDIDPIRQRADRLAALADRAATGLRGGAYVTAVALAANLSAADVPDLLAEMDYERRMRFEFDEKVTEQVEKLRAELAEMKADRDGWRDAANNCGGA